MPFSYAFYEVIMSEILSSILLGLFFMALLFVICCVLVIGCKTIIVCINNYLKDKLKNPQEPLPQPPKKVVKAKRVYKPIKSIEINPDEVDKIYVKKSS